MSDDDDGASDRQGRLQLTVLGGFEAKVGDEVIVVPPGRPALLVKLLAVSGGSRSAADAALELWPEADAATARRRLRNVLNRLQGPTGPLVVRRGDELALPPNTWIDAQSFEAEARAALDTAGAAPDPAAARTALERYRGELLPGEHADWASLPRERLRSQLVELLDRLADAAQARQDFDDAARLLRRGIEVDRFDERRYLLLARLLAKQGRRGAALDTLRRGTEALAELGVDTPPEYAELAERLRRVDATASALPADDLRAALEVVGEIHGAATLEELRQLLVHTVRRLAPADFVSLNELRAGGVPVWHLAEPPVPEERLAAWQRLGHTNPLVQRYMRTGDGRPYRFSDIVSPDELEALPLFREFYAPLGIRHQIAFTLPAPREVTVAIVLSRRDPDFSDRERDLLDLARPHIIQAYRNVQGRD